MAYLAARLAARGHPVFRFDRRGVGDSTGENRGWSRSAPDLAAAVASFRTECRQVERIVGFGNCDGATSLALFGRAAGVDALVLANPWTGDDRADGLPPPAAIRARYAARLRTPGAWRRLLTGDVALGKLIAGLRKALRSTPGSLAKRIAAVEPDAVILAQGDATAQAFRGALPRHALGDRIVTIPTASHSFAGPGDAEALEAAVLAALSATR